MVIDYILKLYLQVFLISYLQVLDQIVCVDQVVNSTNYKFEFPSPADRPRAPIISFSDASSGYPGGPISFPGIDLDSQLATLRLGLPFVPSHLAQAGSIDCMIQRVDFASAGIILSSGSELGQQIEQITDTIQQFIMTIGKEATSDVISTSVFYISIGTNDYIRYYLWNVSDVQSCYLPWSFNQFLAQTMKQEIKNLYNAHVRKVVVMGLAPIGCAPYYLWLYHSNNGQYVATINDMILEYFAERYIVAELNEKLVGATVLFCDAFEGSMDIIQNHDRYGFNVTDGACCGLGKYKGWILCISPEMACSFNVTDEACCGLGNIQKLGRVDNWKSPLVGLVSSITDTVKPS